MVILEVIEFMLSMLIKDTSNYHIFLFFIIDKSRLNRLFFIDTQVIKQLVFFCVNT